MASITELLFGGDETCRCGSPAEYKFKSKSYCENCFKQRVIDSHEPEIEYHDQKQHGEMNSIGLDT